MCEKVRGEDEGVWESGGDEKWEGGIEGKGMGVGERKREREKEEDRQPSS